MKKSDLVSGKHVTEIREDEKRFLLLGDKFIAAEEFCEFRAILPDLSHKTFEQLDIVKIYEIEEYQDLNSMLKRKKGLKLVWERKPELSDAERVILKNIEKRYKYIVRDEDGEMEVSKDFPIKKRDYWFANGSASFPFCNLFKMIQWEDSKPILISDLLGGQNEQSR